MCVYVHISKCEEFVHQLPLLPDNTASETFSHKSGAVRSVDRIFTTGTPWLAVTGRTHDTIQNVSLSAFETGSNSSLVTATFVFLSHS